MKLGHITFLHKKIRTILNPHVVSGDFISSPMNVILFNTNCDILSLLVTS